MSIFSKKVNFVYVMLMAVLFTITASLSAKAGLSIIRDTEIEKTLEEWIRPLLKVNNMPVGSVKIIIVQSPDINAFVAGGANIFIYTGLIEKSENPEEIIGVLAHELGHIAGGHLVRSREAIERASYEMILGTLLGIGAAIATGNGGAAAAISAGTGEMAKRKFLSFSRVQESSADQAALKSLQKANISADGLKSFMEKLKNENLLPENQQSEYVRTHPLTGNRIEAISAAINKNPAGKKANNKWIEQHSRMKAKLMGFIKPEYVDWNYDDNNHSIDADYARAVAAYKKMEIEKSLKIIDSLIKRENNNPYFIELKAQMLMDYGNIDEAVILYKKTVDILPDAPLIRSSLAHALIESYKNGSSKNILKEAISNLKLAIKKEPRNAKNYRFLAIAYGKIGKDDMAQLYLAEEAFLHGNYEYAINRAEFASRKLENGSKDWIRAQDIIHYSKMHLSKSKK